MVSYKFLLYILFLGWVGRFLNEWVIRVELSASTSYKVGVIFGALATVIGLAIDEVTKPNKRKREVE